MILKPTPQKLDKFFKQHGVKTQMPEGFGGQRHGQPFTTGYYEEYPFIVEYLNAVQDMRANSFKEKYRQYDVLIMDDIQFFSKKPVESIRNRE